MSYRAPIAPSPYPSQRGKARRLGCLLATTAVAVLLVASPTIDASANAASAPPAVGTSAQLQSLIQKTFQGSISVSQFGQTMRTSLQIAAKPFTPAQQATLFHCLSVETCVIGKGPLTIGLDETNGVNGVRRLWRLEATAQAMAYPEVGKVIYLDANNDLPTFLSNTRSLISQKVTMIISAFDFGAAVVPVMQQAESAGIDVISMEPIAGAKPNVDYGFLVESEPDTCTTWTQEAQTAVKTLGKNQTYGLYTGPVGNPYGAIWQPCVQKVLDAAGWTEVISGNTDWTPQGEQQAGTALIASGKQVDALFYDYTPENLIESYISAQKTPPAVFVQQNDAGMWKLYRSATASGLRFPVYVQATGGTWDIRGAVTAGVEKAEGKKVPVVVTYPFVLAPLSKLIKGYNTAYPVATPMAPIISPAWAKRALLS
jgi:ABC-type sugar transport system substrate-binding protein